MLPRGPHAALAEKFLLARGYRIDRITVATPVNGAGPLAGTSLLSGTSLGGNGHVCDFAASAAETTRTGARFRITDDPAAPDEYSISFVVTPQVVLRVGGNGNSSAAHARLVRRLFPPTGRLVAKVKARGRSGEGGLA